METIAKEVAGKLNAYPNKNLIKFVIPQKGFSSLSVEGGALYDPASDQVFIDALRKYLDPAIKVMEVDTDINKPEFARVVVEALKESFESQGKGHR